MILPVLIDAVLGIQHVLCHVSSGISDTGVTSMDPLPLPSVYGYVVRSFLRCLIPEVRDLCTG